MINQECKVRPKIVNASSNEPVFYPFSIKTNKCSGSCNNINDPYAKMCLPGVAKNLIVKVFNLMSKTNETRHIEWHEMCKCISKLDVGACNNKQRWNNDKYRCECKEIIDKGICDKGFICNPNNCQCECDEPCDVDEYLDYENYKCRQKIVDKLVVECSENIDEVKIAKKTSTELHSVWHENVCVCSQTLCVILAVIALAISIGISAYFAYSRWYLKKDITRVKFRTHAQTTI